MISRKITSLSLLLLLGFVWGTGYSIAHFATTHGVSALGYSFWQSLGPAILISLFSFRWKNFFPVLINHYRYFFICGLTGIVIPNTNMYFAAAHIPAGIMAVIVNTVPIMVYLMALLARLETFQILRFLGICSALCGLMLMILPQAHSTTSYLTPWLLSTLITPLSFAFCSIYIASYRPSHISSMQLAAGTLIFSSVMLTPLVLLSGDFYMLHLPMTTPDLIIVLEIILSSLGYVLFFQLIKIAGPVYYSLVDTIVALTGLFWGFVIFHETLHSWTLMAVFLILLALVLVTKRQKAVIEYTS